MYKRQVYGAGMYRDDGDPDSDTGDERIYPCLLYTSLEILIIVHKITGKRGQFFSLLFKLRGADGGNQAGIHSPGEEGTDGNIGDHLAFDRVLNEKGRLLNGLFVAVLMRKAH